MNRRNKNHRTAFTEAIEKLNRKAYVLMADAYLLTAEQVLCMKAGDEQLFIIKENQIKRRNYMNKKPRNRSHVHGGMLNENCYYFDFRRIIQKVKG